MSAKYTFWAWDQPINKAPLKLALLQLSDNANDDGVSWYSVPKMAARCGMSERAMQGHIATLVEMGLLRITDRPGTSRIYALQYQQAQIIADPRKLCSTPPQNLHPTPAESADDPNNEPNIDNKTSSSVNLSDSTDEEIVRKKYSFTAEDMTAAEYIADKVDALAGSPGKHNLQSWANTIRLMRERDGRNHREICDLFKWANRDSFWKDNVLSPDTLRKQWQKLTIRRNSERSGTTAARPALDFNNTDWADKLGE